MVGVTGFEPATSWSQTRRSTKLSYTPQIPRALRFRKNGRLLGPALWSHPGSPQAIVPKEFCQPNFGGPIRFRRQRRRRLDHFFFFDFFFFDFFLPLSFFELELLLLEYVTGGAT